MSFLGNVIFFQKFDFFLSGCDPHIMGIGPSPAIRLMLEKTGQKLEDMEMIEVCARSFQSKEISLSYPFFVSWLIVGWMPLRHTRP